MYSNEGEFTTTKDGMKIGRKVYQTLIRKALSIHIADVERRIRACQQCPLRCPKITGKRVKNTYSKPHKKLPFMPRKLLPSYVSRKILKREREVGRELEENEERDIRKRFDQAELMMRKGFEQNKTFSEITKGAEDDWRLYTAYMESLDIHPDDIPATPVRDENDERMETIAENIGQAVIQPPTKELATPGRTRPLMGVSTNIETMRDIYNADFSPITMRQLETEDAGAAVSPEQRTPRAEDTEAKSEEGEEEEEEEEESEEEEELPLAIRRPRRKRAKPQRLGFP